MGANPQANTLIGFQAGISLTTGRETTCIGYLACGSSTGTGMGTEDGINTAIGSQALADNTTGEDNTAIGQKSCTGVVTGSGNVCIGAHAGFSMSGSANVAIIGGNDGTLSDQSGSNDVYIRTPDRGRLGNQRGQHICGRLRRTKHNHGELQCFCGGWAGQRNTTGAQNTFFGAGAAQNSSTGSFNTALGASSALALTGGSNNTLIGTGVGSTTLATGSSNILIGTSSAVDTPAAGTSGFLNIGNAIFATGMTGSLSSPAGNVGIGTTSPQATLDVNGYARLTLNSSPPVACSSSNSGALALNHAQMCACNGSSWIFADSTGAACRW